MVDLAQPASRRLLKLRIDRLRERLVQDSLFFKIIAATFLFAACAAGLFHRAYLDEVIEQYVTIWTLVGVIGFVIFFTVNFASRAIRERPSLPSNLAAQILRSMFRLENAAGLLCYYALAVFMGSFTTVKTILPALSGFWADPWLSSIDRALHFGHDPWLILQPLLGYHAVTQIVEFIYGPTWLICYLALIIYFSFTTQNMEHRRQVILAFLLIWIINGIVLSAMFMSGGPAFYGLITHDSARYADLVKYLSFDSSAFFSAQKEQHQLWALHAAGSSNVGAGISAFPSLHVSMILLCCLAASKVSRLCAYATKCVAVVIILGAVHLGWHYAVGVYIDFILIPAIWWLSGRCAAYRTPVASAGAYYRNTARPLPPDAFPRPQAD
jgi:hypothetical protein